MTSGGPGPACALSQVAHCTALRSTVPKDAGVRAVLPGVVRVEGLGTSSPGPQDLKSRKGKKSRNMFCSFLKNRLSDF